MPKSMQRKGRDDIITVKIKYTKPHPCIVFMLVCNYSVKICRDRALYTYLHTFWHVIPISFCVLCSLFSCGKNTNITLHGRSKRSGWSGFGPTTFSQTQLARCMRTLNTRTYASRRPRPAFHCLQAVRVLPATESWAGAWGTTTTHSVCNVNQNPVCL